MIKILHYLFLCVFLILSAMTLIERKPKSTKKPWFPNATETDTSSSSAAKAPHLVSTPRDTTTDISTGVIIIGIT